MTTREKKAWLKNLPHARPIYPERLIDRLKYYFWRIITPLHPHARDLLTYVRILRCEGRQNYLLGRLAPHQTIETFVEYLLEKGFGNHFVAFKDEGQLVSLRYTPNFKYQYHIRIFNDGEVRGHFEPTPEHSPIQHMLEKNMEHRFDEFLALLGDKIIPAPLTTQSNFSWSILAAAK